MAGERIRRNLFGYVSSDSDEDSFHESGDEVAEDPKSDRVRPVKQAPRRDGGASTSETASLRQHSTSTALGQPAESIASRLPDRAKSRQAGSAGTTADRNLDEEGEFSRSTIASLLDPTSSARTSNIHSRSKDLSTTPIAMRYRSGDLKHLPSEVKEQIDNYYNTHSTDKKMPFASGISRTGTRVDVLREGQKRWWESVPDGERLKVGEFSFGKDQKVLIAQGIEWQGGVARLLLLSRGNQYYKVWDEKPPDNETPVEVKWVAEEREDEDHENAPVSSKSSSFTPTQRLGGRASLPSTTVNTSRSATKPSINSATAVKRKASEERLSDMKRIQMAQFPIQSEPTRISFNPYVVQGQPKSTYDIQDVTIYFYCDERRTQVVDFESSLKEADSVTNLFRRARVADKIFRGAALLDVFVGDNEIAVQKGYGGDYDRLIRMVREAEASEIAVAKAE